jgi:DNA repair photolyase
MISALTKHFGKVNIMIRPIIPGKNDNKKTLTYILDIAKEYDMNVIFGGYLDKNRQKFLHKSTDRLIRDLSEKRGLKFFYKTSCAAAYVKKIEC